MKDIDFVHLSDTHLGYRQYGLDERFKVWGRATRQVVDYAVDHDVDAVIHSGDLFNSAKPGRDALLQATRIFEPLKEGGIPFLVIRGNHDRGRGKQRCGAIDVLDRLSYCELLDPLGKDISEAVYKLNGYNFIGLGYPGIDLEGWIDDLSEDLPENGDNIVLLHAGVEGHFERWASHITDEELKKLKEKTIYLALGHSHGSFRLDNWAFNPGSVERGKIEPQQSPKIFYHVEMKGRNVSANKIEINTRETHYFKITAENNWGKIVEQCKEKARGTDLEGDMVRVDVHGELEPEFRRGELEEIFKGKPLVLNISDETLSEEKRSGGWIERRARGSAIGTLETALKVKGIKENEIDEAIHRSGIDIEEALERSGEKRSGVSTVPGKPLLELLDLGVLSEEDFQELKQALMDLLAEGEQKIIDKSELDEHIDKGWRYVDSVDEERAIVEKQPLQ